MYSPTSPEVSFTPRVMIDSVLGRGRRRIRPGVSWSRPSATPNGALMKKWIHSTCAGVNGWPAAMLSSVAPRNVSTNATSEISTKRTYLVRLS